MITSDDVVQLVDDVRVHVVDDRDGFVETPAQVHRIRGSRLTVVADEVLPRLRTPTRVDRLVADLAPHLPGPEVAALLETLSAQGVLRAAGAPAPVAARADAAFVVYGPARLTDQLVAVLSPLPGTTVRRGDAAAADGPPRALAVVAAASLFDPAAARLHADLVARDQPHLGYGLAPGGAAFVGPLWTAGRAAPCFACLRTRVFSHASNGPTLLAYTAFLAESDRRPVTGDAPPWAVARIIGAVARRALAWAARPQADPATALLWFDALDAEGRQRLLLPVPTCACARPVDAPGPAADLLAAEDDVVGIVHAVGVRRAESGPAIYLAGSTSANFSLIRGAMRVTRNGGAGFTKAAAARSTVGEALERYAAGLYRPADLRLASWADLAAAGEPAAAPESFCRFSEAQYAAAGFPFAPFTRDTPVRWVRASRLGGDDQVWVPASQVYLHYRRVRGEAAIGPSISTGLAAGPSFAEAAWGGLCEVIERDSLALSWLYRLPPRPVAAETVAASAAVSHHLQGATSWRVRFYDLAVDLPVPTVAAVLEHRGAHGVIMSFGSACRPAPVQAVEKAFLEAAQGLTYVRRLLRQHEDWQVAADFGNVDDFNLHAILYSKYPQLRARAGYLVHPTEPVLCSRPPSPAAVAPDAPAPAQLADLAAAVRAAGYEVYVVDLTTDDVRQLGTTVVRVLVPGLQHLSGVHRHRYLGSRRLAEVAARLGITSAPDNPFPHPLP